MNDRRKQRDLLWHVHKLEEPGKPVAQKLDAEFQRARKKDKLQVAALTTDWEQVYLNYVLIILITLYAGNLDFEITACYCSEKVLVPQKGNCLY